MLQGSLFLHGQALLPLQSLQCQRRLRYGALSRVDIAKIATQAPLAVIHAVAADPARKP